MENFYVLTTLGMNVEGGYVEEIGYDEENPDVNIYNFDTSQYDLTEPMIHYYILRSNYLEFDNGKYVADDVINKFIPYEVFLNDDGYLEGFGNTFGNNKYVFDARLIERDYMEAYTISDTPMTLEQVMDLYNCSSRVAQMILDGVPEGMIYHQPDLDEAKKQEIIKKREEEKAKPTEMELVQAQLTYTAMMTDTLIEKEESEPTVVSGDSMIEKEGDL